MKIVYILMTQWKDGDPEATGVFSSFDKAAAFFVRMLFRDASMSIDRMQSEAARVALKLAHQTDDEDYADFGNTRAWIEENIVDELCERFETEVKE